MKPAAILVHALSGAMLAACATLGFDEEARPGHGAVAFSSSTQEWRIVNNAGTAAGAERQAQDACGAACAILVRFGPGECGTLALNALGQHASAVGQSVETAEFLAMRRCESTGHPCRVAPAQCNRGAG